MNKNLTEILQKALEDLSEAEKAEIQANYDQLDDKQKEKFVSLKEDSLPTELEVKASYDTKTKVAVASTDVVDRHGERINQEGWELKNFKKNPVLLWGHDHSEIAVGNARNIHIERAGGSPRLVFTPDFHDKTEKAKALKSLFEEGWLNSFSVGFVPKEFDGKDSTYVKQELLEISAVNVPANPEATMMGYKSLVQRGFNKDVAEEVSGLKDIPKDKLSERVKASLADALEEMQDREDKWKNMEQVSDIYWAFCDIYYEEDTDVEDFISLLKEMIEALTKVSNGEVVVPTDEEEPDEPVNEALDIEALDVDNLTTEDAKKVLEAYDDQQLIDKAKAALLELKGETGVKPDKVLDKNPDNLEDDNKTAKTQDNKDTSAAPNTKEARAKQSLSKVIAKASDKLLEDKKYPEVEQYAKLIKRAAEVLNKAHKNK